MYEKICSAITLWKILKRKLLQDFENEILKVRYCEFLEHVRGVRNKVLRLEIWLNSIGTLKRLKNPSHMTASDSLVFRSSTFLPSRACCVFLCASFFHFEINWSRQLLGTNKERPYNEDTTFFKTWTISQLFGSNILAFNYKV